MAQHDGLRPEFSRLVDPRHIVGDELRLEIAADPAERAALAARFDLLTLDELTAQVTIRALSGGLFRVCGHLDARVVQRCVVTLRPVESRIAADFSLLFGAAPEPSAAESEIFIDLDAVDPPEPIAPQGLDIGEAVVQVLSDEIEPYPRHPEAGSEAATQDLAERDGESDSPFAALAKMKDEK